MESKEFLTISEAAELSGLSHWTIRKYLRECKLEKYTSGSRIVVNRDELLRLLEPKRVEAH